MAADNIEPHAIVRPRSYEDESYLHGFLGTVGDLQKAGVLQDVVLEVEGRWFPCHRLVLSAASPYFRAMFTSDMAESRQKTVVLQGLDADIFGEILSYIYSGTLHVSLDKVQPLYQAADLLQLDYVRDTCSSYMAMNVERSTCVDLYKFAEVFSVGVVRKRCLQLIAKHFTEIASSEDFYSLSVNQLTEIISHDELDVKEETTVWEAVVRWVQHSREDRMNHLPSILPHIRFNLLTSDETTAILEHSFVSEDPGSSGGTMNAVQKGDPDLKPRHGMFTEMMLLFRVDIDEILFMNPQEGKYISCSYDETNFAEAWAMTVTSDNDIYLLSSELHDSYNDLSMFKYNHAENVWKHAGMSAAPNSVQPGEIRFQKLLVEVDHFFYNLAVEMGGSVHMRKYNRHTDQWQDCSQLQIDAEWNFSVSLLCGPHLYFIMNSEMHRYNPIQDSWCERTPPELIPKVWTAVAMGTEIFCTDRDFTQTMVYDTETAGRNCKAGQTSMLRLKCPIFLYWGTSCMYGTATSNDYLVYVYDRSTDAWSDLKASIPNEEYEVPSCECPVARVYLPYLRRA
uniref:BTB domain-containing protein n=1 Tax=Branchiostoma floridae TaxID=7739 RepID=C3ZP09_BRAFL|eukprot:XP_002589733.1 hypothetical protein BRAFLDRAFT_97784 [Branchiostoma floridae]